jgi:hypothetical protein
MSETDLVEIYRAANSLDAQLLKGELEAAGIPTQITDESFAALSVPPLWWASPRLLVAEADAAKAAAILRELEAARVTRPTSGNTD